MLMKTASVVAVFGLLCAWMQVLSPPGKLKKTVAFALGVLLCAFAAEQLASAADSTALWRKAAVGESAVSQIGSENGGAGGAYARQIVGTLAGTDAQCTVLADKDGAIRGFRISLPEGADVFSHAQTRRRITTALCGIYDIEPEAVVFD